MVTPYIGIGDVGSNPSLTTISYLSKWARFGEPFLFQVKWFLCDSLPPCIVRQCFQSWPSRSRHRLTLWPSKTRQCYQRGLSRVRQCLWVELPKEYKVGFLCVLASSCDASLIPAYNTTIMLSCKSNVIEEGLKDQAVSYKWLLKVLAMFFNLESRT